MGKQLSNITKSAIDPAGMFTSKNTQTVVQAPAATEMPDPDGEAVKAAKRRKAAAAQQRGGRASTMLVGQDDLLGG